jgi:hypothetical protein
MKYIFLLGIVFFCFESVKAQEKTAAEAAEIIAGGGSFKLEKAVVAGGGSQMSHSSIDQNGTGGQAAAGVRSTGGNFTLYSGFWTPDDLAPTAANALVGGRIRTASGSGIRSVQVTIAFPTGETRTTLSSSFGYYRFADIPTGGVYVISVSAKKYAFSQPAQIRSVQDDVQDVDFVADE